MSQNKKFIEGLQKISYDSSGSYKEDHLFLLGTSALDNPWLKEGILPPHGGRWYVVPDNVMVSLKIIMETYKSKKFPGIQFTVKYLSGTVDRNKRHVYALQWK